jgi:hypothetical protein
MCVRCGRLEYTESDLSEVWRNAGSSASVTVHEELEKMYPIHLMARWRLRCFVALLFATIGTLAGATDCDTLDGVTLGHQLGGESKSRFTVLDSSAVAGETEAHYVNQQTSSVTLLRIRSGRVVEVRLRSAAPESVYLTNPANCSRPRWVRNLATKPRSTIACSVLRNDAQLLIQATERGVTEITLSNPAFTIVPSSASEFRVTSRKPCR